MNVHTCTECGWETRAPDHVIQIFHPCQASRSRRRLRRLDSALIAAALDREAERAQWAADTFGPLRDSLEDAVGGEHQWYEEDE